MEFQIDSGVDISIVGDDLIRNLELEDKICQTTVSMKGVAGESLNVLGEVEVMVQYKEETHNMRFVVVANVEDLISGRDVGRLGILAFDQPEVSMVIIMETILMIQNWAGNGNSGLLEQGVEQG